MQKLLIVDTETGGLEPAKHSLLEVALGVWQNGELIDVLNLSVVHDVYYVTQRALEINNIDLRRKRYGYTPEEAKEAITAFLDGHFPEEKATIVGQNVHFDIGFLTELFTKDRYEELFSHRTIDTASIIRYLDMVGTTQIGSAALRAAVGYFGIDEDPGSAHTALGDVKTTAKVLNKLLEAGRGLL